MGLYWLVDLYLPLKPQLTLQGTPIVNSPGELSTEGV